MSFLFLEKLLYCAWGQHLHCKALSDQFYNICLNLSRVCSPVHITVHPAVSISSHTINKHS